MSDKVISGACVECPHLRSDMEWIRGIDDWFYETVFRCKKSEMREIDDPEETPQWCPLLDKQQGQSA